MGVVVVNQLKFKPPVNIQKLKRLTKYFLLGYFVYVLITAVLVFALPIQTESLASDYPMPWINQTDERVVFIEDGVDAFKARIDLINQAEDTLDISYYSVHIDQTADLFYAHLLKAANRGVNIRFAIDGIAQNMQFGQRHIMDLFTKHPNIELVFYEPFDLLRPWTWHNRLHDKLMIADQSFALIGGRNIAEKYFSPRGTQGKSNDYDLLLMSEDKSSAPIIGQIQTYFNQLWDHDYSVIQTDGILSKRQVRRANKAKANLSQIYDDHVSAFPEFYLMADDWGERSHQINRGFYVHNSIERLTKDPVVWRHMLDLVSKADAEVFIQSPYMIPTKQMREELSSRNFDFDQGILLTNGLESSPNPLAHSGYRHQREWLADSTFALYEYQNPNESMHMKSAIIDRQFVTVGSFNFDARSKHLNTESMVILDSPSLASEIVNTISETYMPDSHLVDDSIKSRENSLSLKKIIVYLLNPLTKAVNFLL